MSRKAKRLDPILRPPPGVAGIAYWLMLFCLWLCASPARADAPATLPVYIASGNIWPSGRLGVGLTNPLAPADAVGTLDVLDVVQGDLNLSGLSVGSHALPIQVVDQNGNQSQPFQLDVVVFDSRWQWGDLASDTNKNGLPDSWETYYFSTNMADSYSDPNHNSINNLLETTLNYDPTGTLNPGVNIRAAELFVDTDPGPGNGIPMTPTPGHLYPTVEDVTLDGLSTAALEPGYHSVGIRLQREDGSWSPVSYLDMVVYKDVVPDAPPAFGVVQAEGFAQMLVSPGAGESLSLANATHWDARDLITNSPLSTVGQSPGTYLYYTRFKSLAGDFGNPIAFTVIVQPSDTNSEVPFAVDSFLGSPELYQQGFLLASNGIVLRNSPWLNWSPYGGSGTGPEGTRYSIIGWIGTGDVAANGGGLSVNILLRQGGTLTWLWDIARSTVTQTNDFGMGNGSGSLPRFQNVTSSVPYYFYDSADSRYRSVGFQGTGSIPVSGTRNSVTYFLDQDSTITWLWVRQYRIRLNTSNGSVDNWQEWYDTGAVTALSPRPDPGYVFGSWSGALSGTNAPGALAVTGSGTVNGNFTPVNSVKFQVVEIDGSQSTVYCPAGLLTNITPKVSQVVGSTTGNTRDIAWGWIVDGADFRQGTGTNLSLSLARDTIVTWQRLRQYRLLPVIVPPGMGIVRVQGRQTRPDPDWYDAGAIRLAAQAYAGNQFVEWYFQQSTNAEVDTTLTGELPNLVARFSPVLPLGDFVTVDGGAQNSPNSATTNYRSFLPTTRFKRTLTTTLEYCAFLNSALSNGYIQRPNSISVRAVNPLSDYVTGLQAQWFHGDIWAGTPDFQNLVTNLSVNFGATGPAATPYGTPPCPLTDTKFYCFRLLGQIYSTNGGLVSFQQACADKVQIIFNNAVLLTSTNASTSAVQASAQAGWNDIEIVYTDVTSPAVFNIQWDPAGDTAWQPVPASVLRTRILSDSWSSAVASSGVYDFYHGKELVTLNDQFCNIRFTNGLYVPLVGRERQPIIDVTWYGSMAYCQWLADGTGEPVTLADEWIWEHAASGGNSATPGNYFPWGPYFLGATKNNANYNNYVGGLTNVGSYPLYKDLYDMAGNASEWTTSIYEQGSPADPYMVLRGGNWTSSSDLISTGNRQNYKNRYYGDNKTSFRPAVIYNPAFQIPGYVRVPAKPLIYSPNSLRPDYQSPANDYFLKTSEVNNSEYATFLNWASGRGYCTLSGTNIYGSGTNWQNGRRWLTTGQNSRLQYVSGVFLPAQGYDRLPANNITWYGATAYCSYLNATLSGVTATLPTQWEWENAMLRGTNASGSSLELTYNQGFWPGFYNVNLGVQEWTASAPATNLPDQRVVRGSSTGLPSLFSVLTKADGFAGMETVSDNLGFRPAIVRMVPAVAYANEKLALIAGGSARTLCFVGNSLLTNPAWTWSLVSAPSWITVTNAAVDHCQLRCVPPATNAAGSIVMAVTDGGLTNTLTIPYQVSAGGGYLITGLPERLEMNQGDRLKVLDLHATPLGSATGTVAVAWSLSGVPTNTAWITALTNGDAQLTLSATNAVQSNLVVQAFSGSNSGTASSQVVITPRKFDFIDFPSIVEFSDNQLTLAVPLLAAGGSLGRTPLWFVPPSAAGWARMIVSNGNSGILQLDRSGFNASTNLTVTISDGISSNSATMLVYEQSGAPTIIVAATNFTTTAGSPDASFLIVGADSNLRDVLQWSLSNAPPWISLVPVSGSRSARLVVNASAVRPVTGFSILLGNGSTTFAKLVTASVNNSQPAILGTNGTLNLAIHSGIQNFDFTMVDADVRQIKTIAVAGGGTWLNWWRTGNQSLRIAIDTSTAFKGQFIVSGSDSFVSVSNVVTVNVADFNPAPSIARLPSAITIPRYSIPLKLPFTLEDDDTNANLTVRLVIPVNGVQLNHTGPRSGDLLINPIQTETSYPIVLEVSDGSKVSTTNLQVNLQSPNPDPHLIAAAEYFTDVDPGVGKGTLIPATDNEVYADCASYTRVALQDTFLPAGWHNFGIRFKSVSGAWSAAQYLTFFVYTDENRQVMASRTPDGGQIYTGWIDFAGPGLPVSQLPGATNITATSPYPYGINGTTNWVFNNITGFEDVNSGLVWAEYFLDNDPGLGSGSYLPMDRGSLTKTIQDLVFTVDSAWLPVGNHKIGLRAKTADGRWSATALLDLVIYADQVVTIPPPRSITASEFVWNNVGSPGFGIGLPLSATYTNTEIGVLSDELIDTSPLATGNRLVNIRFKDDAGDWGQTQDSYFTVDQATNALNLVQLHIESNIGIPSLNYNSYQLFGSLLTLQVPMVYFWNNVLYACWGYSESGNLNADSQNNQFTMTLNNNSSVTWFWGAYCNVVSRSDYGEVAGNGNWNWYTDYKAGNGTYAALSPVVLSVPQTVLTASGVRQNCTGFRGAGSAPAIGYFNSVMFYPGVKDSEVNWSWQQQDRVDVAVVGEGQVFGSAGWVDTGSAMTLKAVPNDGFQFVGWQGDITGINTNQTFTVNAPMNITAVFTKYRFWQVDVGNTSRILLKTYADGATVTVASPATQDIAPGARYAITGWTGAGSAPAVGSGLTTNFVIHADSEIRWKGNVQFWVDQRTNGAGLGFVQVSGARTLTDQSWFDQGLIHVTATPSNDCTFVRWLTDLDGAPGAVDMTLKSPLDLAALFRSTNLATLELVNVPQMSIAGSSNAAVAGFTPYLPAFSLAKYETTTRQYVEELNAALVEGSIYVTNSKVFGLPELVPYVSALNASWSDIDSNLISTVLVSDLSSSLVPPSSKATRCLLRGQFFVGAELEGKTLNLGGSPSARATIQFSGTQVVSNQLLPVNLTLPAGQKWNDVVILMSNISSPVLLNISGTNGPVTLASGSLRNLPAPQSGMSTLLTGNNFGDDLNQMTLASTVILADTTFTARPKTAEYWWLQSSDDLQLQSSIARQDAGPMGLMLRQTIRSDAPYLETFVDSLGALNVKYRPVENAAEIVLATPRGVNQIWTVRLTRLGSKAAVEFLENGQWLDAVTGTTELTLLPGFADANQVPLLGFHSTVNGTYSGVKIRRLSSKFNFGGALLADMSWPGANIMFNGTQFTSAPDKASNPVTCVTYYGATAMAAWLQDRKQDGLYGLPTEWQYEGVQGAAYGLNYPWPDGADSRLYSNLQGLSVTNVGRFNSFNGFYDLVGNVWEWTSSSQWPAKGFWNNIRGCSYRHSSTQARTGYRLFYGKRDWLASEVGFRIARNQSVMNEAQAILSGNALSLNPDLTQYVRGAWSPSDGFGVELSPVSNDDFSAFLRHQQSQGFLAASNGWILSANPNLNYRQPWLQVLGNPGITNAGTNYVSIPGQGAQPVVKVTYYGATSFAVWKSALANLWSYSLPTEWEWQTLLTSGYVASRNAQGSAFGDVGTLYGASGANAWVFAGLSQGLGNWTLSSPPNQTNTMIVMGTPFDQAAGTLTSVRGSFMADRTNALSNVGFRLLVKPKNLSVATLSSGKISMAIAASRIQAGFDTRLVLARSGDTSFAKIIYLTATDSRVTLPASVTFPSGVSSVTVTVLTTNGPATLPQADFQIIASDQNQQTLSVAATLLDPRTASVPTASISLSQNISGHDLVISWANSGVYTLQQNANMAGNKWLAAPYPVTTFNGTNSVTIPMVSGSMFFRLQSGIQIPVVTMLTKIASGTMKILWPNLGNYTLQQNTNIGGSNWIPTAYPVTTVSGTNSVTVPIGIGSLFFRLVL